MKIEVMYQERRIEVNCPAAIAEQLEELQEPKKGTFAYVRGHESLKGYETPNISNILFISNPIYHNYVKRLLEKVEKIEWYDVLEKNRQNTIDRIIARCDMGNLNVSETFKKMKENLIESLIKSLSGDKDSNQRQASETFYCYCNGWKLHLESVEVKKKKELILDLDGTMTVDSIIP